MLLADIPWNPQTLKDPNNHLVAANIVGEIILRQSDRDVALLRGEWERAGWMENRIVQLCDELERRGFFNLARGPANGLAS